MASDFDRRETTAELSAKALKRLRKEFNLVSSEVRHQRPLAKLQEAFDRSVAAPNGVGQRRVVAHVARSFLRGGSE